MENGDFYASTGVTLKEVVVKNNVLNIKIAAVDKVKYTIDFIGVAKGEQASKVLKTVSANEASFDLSTDHLFVRARITSDKIKENPFKDADVEMAWTQPVVAQP